VRANLVTDGAVGRSPAILRRAWKLPGRQRMSGAAPGIRRVRATPGALAPRHQGVLPSTIGARH